MKSYKKTFRGSLLSSKQILQKSMSNLFVVLLIAAFSFSLSVFSLGEDKTVGKSDTEDEFISQAKQTLSSLKTITELHIKKILDSFEILVATNEAKSCDWEKIKPLLSKVAETNVSAVIFFVKPDGTYWTIEKGLIDKNLKDREYFPDLLAGKKVIGSLVVSKSTGEKSAIVAVPIKDGDKVIGALGASIFLEKLSERIKKDMGFCENTIFYGFDSSGEITIDWKIDLIFKDVTKIGNEEMMKAMKEMLTKQEGFAEYEFNGLPRKVIFCKSQFLDWHIAFGIVGKR